MFWFIFMLKHSCYKNDVHLHAYIYSSWTQNMHAHIVCSSGKYLIYYVCMYVYTFVCRRIGGFSWRFFSPSFVYIELFGLKKSSMYNTTICHNNFDKLFFLNEHLTKCIYIMNLYVINWYWIRYNTGFCHYSYFYSIMHDSPMTRQNNKLSVDSLAICTISVYWSVCQVQKDIFIPLL